MDIESKSSDTKDYEMNYNPGMFYSYDVQHFQVSVMEQNKKKFVNLKEQLDELNNIKTIAEAKELVLKVLPQSKDKKVFYVGDAKCMIVDESTEYSIFVESPDYTIGYKFA